MSVTPSDIIAYGCEYMPEADGVEVGGAVDFSKRVAFYDVNSTEDINFVSSSASDTHVQIQVAGRDGTGVIQTPAAVTLNGTTAVNGSQLFQRLLYGVVSGANPAAAGTYFPLAGPTGGATGTTNASMTNSATSMTFASAPTNFPSSGDYYVGVDTGANFEIMQVTGGQGTATLTVVRGVSGFQGGVAHASGVSVYLMPVGDVMAYGSTAVIPAHTAQAAANHSGTTPPTITLQSGDGVNVSPGQIIQITNNTPSGAEYQLRMIIATSGYGTDVVALNRDWSTIPTSSTTYSVWTGMLFETGFASSGTTYGDPNPVTAVTRCFSTAAADVSGGSNRTFYEKVYTVNNNTATALTSAQAEIASVSPSLPSGAALSLGPGASLDDSLTIANRQTAPSGVTFTAQSTPTFVNVPGGSLPSGNAPNRAGAQAWWIEQALNAGTAAYEGSLDLKAQGTTT